MSAVRFFLYALFLGACFVGAFIVPISAVIEHWSWSRWVVLFFAVAFPLAVIGDIVRETPGQRITRLKRAIRRRDASRKVAS